MNSLLLWAVIISVGVGILLGDCNPRQAINFNAFSSRPGDPAAVREGLNTNTSGGTNDPNYGTTWVYMPDDDGHLQVAVLTSASDSEYVADTSTVSFHLFSRWSIMYNYT